MNALPFWVLFGMNLILTYGHQDSQDSKAQNSLPLSTFTSQYVEVHGARMHYIEAGDGEPILFLHGNPDNLCVWRNIIPHAAEVGHAIGLDLIGMGKSDVPEIEYRFLDHAKYVEGFITKLGLRNITLVGHDWGGELAFHYARHNETNIKGIIFMESGLGPIPSWEVFPESVRAVFQQFRRPELGWDLIVNKNALGDGPRTVRQLTEEELSLYTKPLEDPARRKSIWRFVNEIPIEGEPADMHALLAERQAWLLKTELPILLFYTTPGLLVNESMVAMYKQSVKNLQAIEVGPGFHYPQEENPELIGEEIVKWYRDR